MSNDIILSAEPRGRTLEGTADVDLKPGMCVSRKAGALDTRGRASWELFSRGTTGPGEVVVVNYDYLQGMTEVDTIEAGGDLNLYVPEFGDECRLLVGTALSIVAGTLYSIGATGLIIAGAGVLRPWLAEEDSSSGSERLVHFTRT